MTPENINIQHPLAWAEYVEFVQMQSTMPTQLVAYVVDYYSIKNKLAYLDSVGVYVDIDPILLKDGEKLQFEYYILDKQGTYLFTEIGPFPDRQTATEAGIAKAFEIRENQLEEK